MAELEAYPRFLQSQIYSEVGKPLRQEHDHVYTGHGSLRVQKRPKTHDGLLLCYAIAVSPYVYIGFLLDTLFYLPSSLAMSTSILPGYYGTRDACKVIELAGDRGIVICAVLLCRERLSDE